MRGPTESMRQATGESAAGAAHRPASHVMPESDRLTLSSDKVEWRRSSRPKKLVHPFGGFFLQLREHVGISVQG